jgi:hypothetical protein
MMLRSFFLAFAMLAGTLANCGGAAAPSKVTSCNPGAAVPCACPPGSEPLKPLGGDSTMSSQTCNKQGNGYEDNCACGDPDPTGGSRTPNNTRYTPSCTGSDCPDDSNNENDCSAASTLTADVTSDGSLDSAATAQACGAKGNVYRWQAPSDGTVTLTADPSNNLDVSLSYSTSCTSVGDSSSCVSQSGPWSPETLQLTAKANNTYYFFVTAEDTNAKGTYKVTLRFQESAKCNSPDCIEDACPHSVCEPGAAMPLTCAPSSCLQTICQRVPSCCNTKWTDVCVFEVFRSGCYVNGKVQTCGE